jgi:hypothetical protein
MATTTATGVPGILRPFKEFLESQSLKTGDQVVFYGVPATCTPFIELLCYAARSLPCTFIFVPYLEEDRARRLELVEGIGYQAAESCQIKNPAVIVTMGGLAMPGMPVTVDQIESVQRSHPDARRIGICFMRMFEKAGWLDRIRFDLLVDADIQVTINAGQV